MLNAMQVRPTADPGLNHGFDDERGDYNVVLHDHISYRFEVLQTLGRGSFGVVLKCYDWKNNRFVCRQLPPGVADCLWQLCRLEDHSQQEALSPPSLGGSQDLGASS